MNLRKDHYRFLVIFMIVSFFLARSRRAAKRRLRDARPSVECDSVASEIDCLACSECRSAGRARWGLEPVNESAYALGGKPTSSEVPRSTCRPSRAARRKCQTRAYCFASRERKVRRDRCRASRCSLLRLAGARVCVCVLIPHACASSPIMTLAASLISLFLNLLVI